MKRYQMQYLDWAGNRQSVTVTIAQAEPWGDGSPSFCAVALGSLGYGKRGNDDWDAMKILALNHGQAFLTAQQLED
jgi:hypothetical protein